MVPAPLAEAAWPVPAPGRLHFRELRRVPGCLAEAKGTGEKLCPIPLTLPFSLTSGCFPEILPWAPS